MKTTTSLLVHAYRYFLYALFLLPRVVYRSHVALPLLLLVLKSCPFHVLPLTVPFLSFLSFLCFSCLLLLSLLFPSSVLILCHFSLCCSCLFSLSVSLGSSSVLFILVIPLYHSCVFSSILFVHIVLLCPLPLSYFSFLSLHSLFVSFLLPFSDLSLFLLVFPLPPRLSYIIHLFPSSTLFVCTLSVFLLCPLSWCPSLLLCPPLLCSSQSLPLFRFLVSFLYLLRLCPSHVTPLSPSSVFFVCVLVSFLSPLSLAFSSVFFLPPSASFAPPSSFTKPAAFLAISCLPSSYRLFAFNS